MNTPPQTRRPSIKAHDRWPVRDGLSVAAIYEDFASGIRLTEALIALERSLRDVCIVNKAWSFSMLERLDVRAASLHEAVEADLLVVVTTCAQALPVQITRWLERYLAECSRRPAALVELHDDALDQEDSPPAPSAEISHFAERWQMDMVTNEQFDEFLNADYFRPKIRQPEPAFDCSRSQPDHKALTETDMAMSQRPFDAQPN